MVKTYQKRIHINVIIVPDRAVMMMFVMRKLTRYYDPAKNGMLSQDPARFGANYYSYCGNNPISYFDPSGMVPESTTYGYRYMKDGKYKVGYHYHHLRHGNATKNVFQYYIYKSKNYKTLLGLYTAFISDETGITKSQLSGMSEIDILSRTIFAEDTRYKDGQKAIALCIKNRKSKGTTEFYNTTYGNNYKGVCYKGFTCITSCANDVSSPNNMYGMWSHAKDLAARIMTLNSISKPTGYKGQLFYRANYYLNNGRKRTSGGKTQFNLEGKWTNVKNVKKIGGNTFFDL